MVHAVLLELLRITTPNEKQGMNHSQADMAELPDYNLFAIQLFHRWYVYVTIIKMEIIIILCLHIFWTCRFLYNFNRCIRTAIKDSFPVKQSKVMTVQM